MIMRKRNSIVLIILLFLGGCSPLPVIPDNNDPDNTLSDTTSSNLSLASIIEKACVVKYTFDNQDAKSKGGKQYDGVLMGAPQFIDDTPSGQGKAIFFNGIKEQYINIPYNVFSDYNCFTISLWVKDFQTGHLIGGIRTDTSTAHYNTPYLYLLNEGTFSFCVYYGYNSFGQTTFKYEYKSLQSSGWHHISVSCDSPNKNDAVLRLYIDGSLVESANSYWRDGSSGVSKVNIGGNGEGRFPVYLTAKIDEVAVYNSVLSPEAIRFIYENKL